MNNYTINLIIALDKAATTLENLAWLYEKSGSNDLARETRVLAAAQRDRRDALKRLIDEEAARVKQDTSTTEYLNYLINNGRRGDQPKIK